MRYNSERHIDVDDNISQFDWHSPLIDLNLSQSIVAFLYQIVKAVG
jgi:hypothetical protein